MKRLFYNSKLIISLGIFFIISLISIYSAQKISIEYLGNIFLKQIIFYSIGIIILLCSYYYKKDIIKYSLLFYLFFVFLLLLLLLLGISINGSKCWLIIGPFSFQPSEFMKIFLIIINAKILCKTHIKKGIKKEFKMLLKILLILFIPSILTFLEPDTGVVLIYFLITVSMVLYRGINKKWYLIFLLIFLTFTIIFTSLYFFKKNLFISFFNNNVFYRLDRLLNWHNQSGYQLENSIITIASSGIFGFGINKIPLYFPESSTDFIFTSFSTIGGFIGNIIFLSVIVIFDLTILSLCNKKTKKMDQYLVIGIFTMIFYQQIQNIGMTIGLLPITGITLPFISYGGSSLLSYMFILGILLRIGTENKKYLN